MLTEAALLEYVAQQECTGLARGLPCGECVVCAARLMIQGENILDKAAMEVRDYPRTYEGASDDNARFTAITNAVSGLLAEFGEVMPLDVGEVFDIAVQFAFKVRLGEGSDQMRRQRILDTLNSFRVHFSSAQLANGDQVIALHSHNN